MPNPRHWPINDKGVSNEIISPELYRQGVKELVIHDVFMYLALNAFGTIAQVA
jgi:hypothetical protein